MCDCRIHAHKRRAKPSRKIENRDLEVLFNQDPLDNNTTTYLQAYNREMCVPQAAKMLLFWRKALGSSTKPKSPRALRSSLLFQFLTAITSDVLHMMQQSDHGLVTWKRLNRTTL